MPRSPWKDFREAFIDFEIAKRINRIDYLATEPAQQKHYFIFQTTLKARDSAMPSMNPEEEKPLASQVVPPNMPLEKQSMSSKTCFIVRNLLTESIMIVPCSSYSGTYESSLTILISAP